MLGMFGAHEPLFAVVSFRRLEGGDHVPSSVLAMHNYGSNRRSVGCMKGLTKKFVPLAMAVTKAVV